MTFHRPNARTTTFSGPAFRPQPQAPPSIEHAPITAAASGTSNAAECLTAQQDPPQEDPIAITGSADIVYLSDLQLRPVEWLWQDRLASGTLAMLSGEAGAGKTWVA